MENSPNEIVRYYAEGVRRRVAQSRAYDVNADGVFSSRRVCIEFPRKNERLTFSFLPANLLSVTRPFEKISPRRQILKYHVF